LSKSNSTPYNTGTIVLHWLIATLLFGQIAFGWFLESIPRGVPMRGPYVNLHKSTGLVLALLILGRIFWRLTHPAPPLPSFAPAWERVVSKWNQFGLYTCMLLMPLSGYVASNFSKHGVKLFNVVMLPPWGTDDHRIYAVFNTTHVVTSYLFVALIALHLLGAMRHALRRDGIVARMWPRRRAERCGPSSTQSASASDAGD
jgi:cytochrome b561